MPALTFDAVSMTFPDGTQALDALDLTLTPGELVTLVGPSGCGKTTALRLAAGLEQPSAGRVIRPGNDAVVSYVFQDPTLLEWRTALRNVELVGELRGRPKAQRRERAREALDAVGLAGFHDRHPRQLSGGMRMRVSLARSLVADPALALFDEPFGALDEITRLDLQTQLQHLVTERGLAGLFITHSVSEAVYLSHRVLVMAPRPGHVVAAVEIPWAHPRPAELRYTAEFAELSGHVSALLRQGMRDVA
ncbi:ABC transporter ATP-binding protein [Serinibacter salmoneus]|uniref:NitT/TauT family transport system ATP-binding protein n=1 Tax=Serinibacter salmoneus TaxID=556530 RepID=A0A2A9CW69_9MICO|nr:ABC transporter ATP-binding protein [Serinibacter salmoneus]PFG18678.1 NitT/TauT family transport system ATP-binding protein [Serinibacter salmoneus]